MNTCIKCNEHLEGDGFSTVMYCPNISESDEEQKDYAAPDEGPFYCDFEDEQPQNVIIIDDNPQLEILRRRVELAGREFDAAVTNLKGLVESMCKTQIKHGPTIKRGKGKVKKW